MNNKKDYLDRLNIDLGKVPPSSIEMEENVLGAIMIDNNALMSIIDILKPNSFYKDANRKIYESVIELNKKNSKIDVSLVKEQLKKNGTLDEIGGPLYLSTLTSKISSAYNIEEHAKIIQQKYIAREMIRISAEVQRKAFDENEDVQDIMEFTEKELFNVSQNTVKQEAVVLKDCLRECMDNIQTISKQQGISGIPSGFSKIDNKLAGWQKSDLIIVAGRPSMGKCFGKGTNILMFDGSLKKVEDIIIGDVLMGDDSAPRNVLSLARGREMMYNINQCRAIDYRVNESHILSLKASGTEGSRIHGAIINIPLKDYLNKSKRFQIKHKGYKTSVSFKEQPLLLDPYFLGLWLGDGTSINANITNPDQEIIDYLQEYADKRKEKLITHHPKNRCVNHLISGGKSQEARKKSIFTTLRKMDLFNNKHIPNEYLINSEENRLLLLAGLLDTDGYFEREGNLFEIIQKREGLIRQIKFLCDSLGFRVSIRSKIKGCQNNFKGKYWGLLISGDLHKIPTRIKRKQCVFKVYKRNWRVSALTITQDKIDDYYGFEIDGNKLFLLEDMTVVHNTSIIMGAARNASIDYNIPTLVFSLEMSRLQLTKRMISSESKVESEKLKKGELIVEEWQMLDEGVAKLQDGPLYIDDTAGISVFEINSKTRRMISQYGIKLVIIDYLQLIGNDSFDKNKSREQEVTLITKSLKNMAKRLDIPVILLAQLNRKCEDRPDKKPQISDLKEAGSIEEAADVVCLIYRPEWYGIMEDSKGNSYKGKAVFIIGKHRNGPIGEVMLNFDGRYTQFSDEIDDYTEGWTDKPPEFSSKDLENNFNNNKTKDIPF